MNLIEGSTDIGGSRTGIAMQLAETLGISSDDVKPQVGDTDSVGYTFLTGGSRVTFATGLAAYKLGLDLQEQMKQRAATLWDCDPSAVEVEARTVWLLAVELLPTWFAVSAKTAVGWWKLPTRFLPAARLIPVLPPTELSTCASSVVGTCTNATPRR